MNTDPANSISIDDSSRCAQTFANGKRCTSSPCPDSDYCASHAVIFDARRESQELAATLTDGLDDFTSAATINDFLSRLLLLLAQDRLPPRRGAVMAYTANLLLHTLPAIDRENAPPPTKKLPPRFIWTIPGPPRESLPTLEELAAQKQKESSMVQPTPNAGQ